MSSPPFRDWLYQWIVTYQLLGMLLFDFIGLLPTSFYQAPTAPLHSLVNFRNREIGDPGAILDGCPPSLPSTEAMTYLELVSLFPLGLSLVMNLGYSSRAEYGKTELAGSVWAALTMVMNVVCFHELWVQGDDVFGMDAKVRLLWAHSGRSIIIPAIMAVDMYMRVLDRLREAERV